MAQERPSLGQMRHGAEEPEASLLVEGEEAGQKQAAEECAEYAHRQQERRTSGNPAFSVERDAAARHDHMDMRMMC